MITWILAYFLLNLLGAMVAVGIAKPEAWKFFIVMISSPDQRGRKLP